MEICSKDKCTACKACVQSCPKKCIRMEEDEMSSSYPIIDKESCIDCGNCVRVCPNRTIPSFYYPTNCYAAWSTDFTNRRNAASGGIATEFYHKIFNVNGEAFGVTFDVHKGAYFVSVTKNNIERIKNSKYVYSDVGEIFKDVKKAASKGVAVLFIGLPCQVAGLKNYLHKDYDNVILVDLICHGVSSFLYLKQHISYIEKNKKKESDKLYFRDPQYKPYTLTLYEHNSHKPFYRRRVKENDVYQIAFHGSMSYRENCYNCSYAKRERVGDLTIGDFSGCGKEAQCDFDVKKVSCVLVNTKKGGDFLRSCSTITLEERPLSEAFNYEHQLQSPSKPHPQREAFKKIYIKTLLSR